jgi:hypothetical protein
MLRFPDSVPWVEKQEPVSERHEILRDIQQGAQT